MLEACEDRTTPTPVVNVTTLGDATEGGASGTLRFSRIGDLSASLTANFSVSGTATSGTDFTSLGTTVTFSAGAATADKSVAALGDAGYDPAETVIATVTTGSGYSVGSPSAATVTIADGTPTATDDEFGGDEDDDTTGNVLTNDTDPSNDDLTAALVDEPWFGVVDLQENGAFVYTPPADFFGTDQFTYEVTDEHGGTSTATVTITVDPTEDDPVIVNQTFVITEHVLNGTPVGSVRGIDADYDQELTYSITAGNSAGIFAIDSETGLITVVDRSDLDYETYTTFALTVQVADNATTPRTDTATITIDVANLAEDEEETAEDRIDFLNEAYDYVQFLFYGEGFTYGLSSDQPNGPTGRSITNLNTMIGSAPIFAAAVAVGAQATAEGAYGDFTLAMTNLMDDVLRELKFLAIPTIQTAYVMAAHSEQDTFRLEGIRALMDEFAGYMDDIKDRIILARAASVNAKAALAASNPGFDASFFDAAIINCDIATADLNDLIARSANFLPAAFPNPVPDDYPQFVDTTTRDNLNDIADDLLEALNDLNPDEATAVAAALQTAQDLYDLGVYMNALWQDSDDWVYFYLARNEYIGHGQYNNNGELDAFTGAVDPLGSVFPTDTNSDEVFDNYGHFGAIFGASDDVFVEAAAAFTIFENLPERDALRYRGLDSYLVKMQFSFTELQTVIAGGSTAPGASPLEEDGVRGQILDLINDLEVAELDFELLPQGAAIVSLYNFVLSGGSGFDGINQYLSNTTTFRGLLNE